MTAVAAAEVTGVVAAAVVMCERILTTIQIINAQEAVIWLSGPTLTNYSMKFCRPYKSKGPPPKISAYGIGTTRGGTALLPPLVRPTKLHTVI